MVMTLTALGCPKAAEMQDCRFYVPRRANTRTRHPGMQAITAALPLLRQATPDLIMVGASANGFKTTTSEWLNGGTSPGMITPPGKQTHLLMDHVLLMDLDLNKWLTNVVMIAVVYSIKIMQRAAQPQ